MGCQSVNFGFINDFGFKIGRNQKRARVVIGGVPFGKIRDRENGVLQDSGFIREPLQMIQFNGGKLCTSSWMNRFSVGKGTRMMQTPFTRAQETFHVTVGPEMMKILDKSRKAQLFERHPQNPILTADRWPYPINTVFNPGVTKLADGTTLLLCRIEDTSGRSHLCAARSKNGVDGWDIDPEPTLMPDVEHFPEELWGIEDARITYVPEFKKYAVVYTAYSRGGPGVSLALTQDFKHFERYGAIMTPEDKDAALIPTRIGNLWAIIHRPVTPLGAHIWISYSPDLRHWGNHKLILEARRGGWWDANKIGLSPPLIQTPDGWLMLYHGVRETASGALYRLGLALFDLEKPEHCLLRGEDWIFGPHAPYERHGDVFNVVFPCGYTISDDKDTLNMYYGAADTSVALATASIRELLAWLKKHGTPYASGIVQ